MRKQRTLELEGEVIGQVSALVVATEKEECIGVVDLERPEVEDTLEARTERVRLALPWLKQRECSPPR